MFKKLIEFLIRNLSGKKPVDPVKEPIVEPPKPVIEPPKEITPMESNFDKSLGLILEFEGGFVNDPADRGGATNFGVIQKRYDEYRDSVGKPRQSVEFISKDEVKEIYYKYYWQAAKCDQLPVGLDTLHFDAAVNTGPTQAAKFLQRALGVDADGVIGTKTIEAANNADIAVIKRNYVTKRADFYVDLVIKDITQLKFLKRWIRRTLYFV